MRVNIYSEKGTKTSSTLELPKEIFGVKPNAAVLRQYIHVYQINQRQGTVATKTRGEVSGGGRKPWAQKGTGRARHGSIRSPIWVGGGVTHGPQPHKFAAAFPRKLRDLALRLALSAKAAEELVLVVGEFAPKVLKTKLAYGLIRKLGARKPLVVFPIPGDPARRAFRNLRNVYLTDAPALNPYEILRAREVVFFRKSVEQLKVRLAGKKSVPAPARKPVRAPAKPAVKVKRKIKIAKKKMDGLKRNKPSILKK